MHSSDTIVKTVLVVCCLILVIAALVTYKLIHRLLRPLDEVNEMIGRVGSGDMTARTQIVEYNEIGTVMLRFNQMVEQVDDLMKKEAENQNRLQPYGADDAARTDQAAFFIQHAGLGGVDGTRRQ